jgi:cobalt-zinc-cadmium efflux system membrane fusion protein
MKYKKIALMTLLNKNLLLGICFIGSLVFVSCSGKTKTEEKTTETTKTEEGEEGIELTQAQIDAVGIQFGTIELKNLTQVIKASGELAVPPQNRADVNVLVGGVIRKIFVIEGQSVKKGQALALIENADLVSIQQGYLTAKNAFSYTAAELQRQKELDEANAGIKKKLQEAQANYNTEKARITTLEAQLRQLGINPAAVSNGNIATQVRVSAPISGTVGHIMVNTGASAQPGSPLLEIIDNSQIHCDLTVFEKDLFKVKAGQKVIFTLTNQENREITGRVYGVNKSFENESKGIIVHSIIENPSAYKLIPGMYVTALISIGSEQVTALPVEAVVQSEGKSYIFVVDEEAKETVEKKKEPKESESKEEKKEDDEMKESNGKTYRFKMVEVITGVSELGYIKITPAGENIGKLQVVVKGANYILSKIKAGGEEEE